MSTIESRLTNCLDRARSVRSNAYHGEDLRSFLDDLGMLRGDNLGPPDCKGIVLLSQPRKVSEDTGWGGERTMYQFVALDRNDKLCLLKLGSESVKAIMTAIGQARDWIGLRVSLTRYPNATAKGKKKEIATVIRTEVPWQYRLASYATGWGSDKFPTADEMNLSVRLRKQLGC